MIHDLVAHAIGLASRTTNGIDGWMARVTQNKGEASREAIIEAAEELMGLHGIDAVPLRQISAAAGSANNYAVQYHFKDRAGLIRAIFEKRLPQVEVIRAQVMIQAKKDGALNDPRTLMNIMCRPPLLFLNGKGVRSYAIFVLAASFSREAFLRRAEAQMLAPLAEHALDLLAKALPHVPLPLLSERVRFASTMVFGSALHLLPWSDFASQDMMIDDIIDMAAAGVAAPVEACLALYARGSVTPNPGRSSRLT